MISVIVKSGDDLRQEQFATQLIKLFDDVFRKSGLPLWLRTYTVLGTSSEAGLIETVPDSISIHSLKERLNITSLRSYYIAVSVNGARILRETKIFDRPTVTRRV